MRALASLPRGRSLARFGTVPTSESGQQRLLTRVRPPKLAGQELVRPPYPDETERKCLIACGAAGFLAGFRQIKGAKGYTIRQFQ